MQIQPQSYRIIIELGLNKVDSKVVFSEPGNYRIEIQGHLLPGWCDRFGAMQVLSSPSSGDGITILQGGVADQVELSGILNTLYELHLPLLSIQYLDAEQSSPGVVTN
jgi:hypothetical protein